MTLMFLHGAGFSGRCFRAQTEAFAGSHAPDLPGRGSPHAAASTTGEFAAFVEQYIRDGNLDDVVLCGHSMGGAVAIEVALRANVPLRALVLLDSGARLRVAPAIFEGLTADFEQGARDVAQYFFATPDPALVDWAVASMRQTGQAQTIADFRACDAFDALERLGEITVPLLALTGEADKMTPPKFAQALSGRVPGAQARILLGAGHFAMVERPEETNAAVGAFLRQLSAA